MTEIQILAVLNKVAYNYESTRNLIKACRKALADKVEILSCEVNNAGYRDVMCLDLETNTKVHLKLVENEEGIYFDSLKKPKEFNFFDMINKSFKDGKSDYSKGYNAGLDKAKEIFLKYITNKILTEAMEEDGYEMDDDDEE